MPLQVPPEGATRFDLREKVRDGDGQEEMLKVDHEHKRER